ncbi:hypothetical protein PTKIN_Ptkin13bG0246900 [Pterospermum kingtungense]
MDVEYDEARRWSEQMQAELGDCLGKGFESSLPGKVNLDIQQNDLSDLVGLWNQMSENSRNTFSERFGQVASLLFVKIKEPLIHAAIQFWDPSYRCFSFNQVDLTPTLEEYTILLGLRLEYPCKIYVKKKPRPAETTLSVLLGIKREDLRTQITKKEDCECVSKEFLLDFIQGHLADEHGRAAFALAIYGLIIFPKVMGHVELHVMTLIEALYHRVNPTPAILAETFRSLNFCQRTGSGRFTGCAQLLYVWLQSHLDGKQKASAEPCLTNHPIRELCEVGWLIAKSKEDWVSFLLRLSEEQVVWMAPWMPQVSVLFRSGKMPWVPLFGLWGVIEHAPLLVLRQFGTTQFVPVTHGLMDEEYAFRESGALERKKSTLELWNDTQRMSLEPFEDKDKVAPGYEIWRNQRVKDVALSLVVQGLEAQKKEWEKEKSKLQEMVSQLKCGAVVQEINLSNIKRDRDMVQANLEDLQKENKKLKIQPSEEQEMETECLKAAVEFWKGKAKDNGQQLDKELQERQVLKEKHDQILLKLEMENKKLNSNIEFERRKHLEENERLVHECQFKEEMYSKAVRSMKEYQKRIEELEAQLNQN